MSRWTYPWCQLYCDTTATHYCNTLLQHTNVPMMSPLLWYSNMSHPWAWKPRFWSLRSQTEHFFTTRVENRTLPIIWVFLRNRSNTIHFLYIPLRITISIWNEVTHGSVWKIKSKVKYLGTNITKRVVRKWSVQGLWSFNVTPFIHIWMSHVTHLNESCHTEEWVMSHIWMRNVTHMKEACRTSQ